MCTLHLTPCTFHVAPCTLHHQGRCKYGDKCLFLHDPDLVEVEEEYEEEEWEEEDVEERPVCEHFLRGSCSYGAKCWKVKLSPPLLLAPYPYFLLLADIHIHSFIVLSFLWSSIF